MAEQQRPVYLVRAGKGGEDEEIALEEGLALIGYLEVPSLAKAADYAAVQKIVASAYPSALPRAIGNIAGQLWALADAMKEGDIVVLPRKRTSQIALGRVKGPYQYQTVGAHLRHTRKGVMPILVRLTLLYSGRPGKCRRREQL